MRQGDQELEPFSWLRKSPPVSHMRLAHQNATAKRFLHSSLHTAARELGRSGRDFSDPSSPST